MSSEGEQNSFDENKKRSNTLTNTNGNNIIEELLKDPIIKELVVKIEVLKNGIITEREKKNYPIN